MRAKSVEYNEKAEVKSASSGKLWLVYSLILNGDLSPPSVRCVCGTQLGVTLCEHAYTRWHRKLRNLNSHDQLKGNPCMNNISSSRLGHAQESCYWTVC